MVINKYIKELLYLNDCVIIPDFGGFVSSYRPAGIKHNRFTPPSKEIAFNPKLQNNDGLLVNFISEKEGIGYFDAKQKVETFVDESLLKLQNYETITFEGIGKLYYNQKENLIFEPSNETNLLADSYGLESFSFERLYQRMVPEPAIRIEDRDAVKVVFNKRQLKRVLVGVPLILALALIPLKNNKELVNTSDLNILNTITKSEEVKQEVDKAAIEIDLAKIETKVVEEQKTIPVQKLEYKYFIIGGSFKYESNANSYISQLAKKGITAQNIGYYNGLHRVSVKGYSDFNKAKEELTAMRNAEPSSGYWIHINK